MELKLTLLSLQNTSSKYQLFQLFTKSKSTTNNLNFEPKLSSAAPLTVLFSSAPQFDIS